MLLFIDVYKRVIIRDNGRAHGSLLYVFCMHSIVAPGMFHLADHQLDNMLYSSKPLVFDGKNMAMMDLIMQRSQSTRVYSLEVCNGAMNCAWKLPLYSHWRVKSQKWANLCYGKESRLLSVVLVSVMQKRRRACFSNPEYLLTVHLCLQVLTPNLWPRHPSSTREINYSQNKEGKNSTDYLLPEVLQWCTKPWPTLLFW